MNDLERQFVEWMKQQIPDAVIEKQYNDYLIYGTLDFLEEVE